MIKVHLDFETASDLDLSEVGASAYAEHPSTRLLSAAYAVEDEVYGWTERYEDRPTELLAMAANPNTLFHAHNAAFERIIWRRFFPDHPLPIPRWRCSMAACAYRALPLALDEAADALGLEQRKDPRGKTLKTMMCGPVEKVRAGAKTIENLNAEFGLSLSAGTPVDEIRKQLLPFLLQYNKQDVRTEQDLEAAIGGLPPSEQRLWELDQEINDRGVRIDRELVEAGIKICAAHSRRVNATLATLTEGRVTAATQVARLKDWAEKQAPGLRLDSLAKDIVPALIARWGDGLPPAVIQALNCRLDAGKTSTGKLVRMLDCSSVDGRARDQAQYHGASTGRWAGRLIQLQNLPRPTEREFGLDPDIIRTGDLELVEAFYDAGTQAVSDAIRNMIIADEGNTLLCGDFSAIEAVVLAGVARDERKLQVFRDVQAGLIDDVYCATASGIYGRPISKKKDKLERSVGKIAELASGYQGGVGAWHRFGADRLGWTDEAIKEKVEAWRDLHPLVAGEKDPDTGFRRGGLWRGLQRAAILAVRTSGRAFSYNDITYQVEEVGGRAWLSCQLLSGRKLWYFQPRLDQGEFGPKLSYMAMRQLDAGQRVWCRVDTYGGKLTENVVQAVARDLLVYAMWRVNSAGLPIILTVHDEILAEVPMGAADVPAFEKLMESKPSYAADWPIKVEAWSGKYYRK